MLILIEATSSMSEHLERILVVQVKQLKKSNLLCTDLSFLAQNLRIILQLTFENKAIRTIAPANWALFWWNTAFLLGQQGPAAHTAVRACVKRQKPYVTIYRRG